MATISHVSISLVNNPPIYHGFWHSYGSSFPAGPVLTVNTKIFAFTTSAASLLTAWVISRLWGIIEAVIFKSIYERTKTSLEESQCAALLVNNSAPISTLTAAGGLLRRGGPKGTLTKIVIASLFVILLKASIPGFAVILPTRRQGLIASTDCGYVPRSNNQDAVWGHITKWNRFSDAALISTDQNRTRSKSERKASTLDALPTPNQSYVPQCPTGATCHTNHTFNFSSVYTLTSKNIGFNIGTPFSIQVWDTCYRPIDAMVEDTSGTTSYTLNYLYYGPFGYGAASISPITDIVFREQTVAQGYSMRSLRALYDSTENIWHPNSTLVLGGDTTILFYFLGFVFRRNQTDDPIFATSDAPNPNITDERLFETRYFVSPIICDTKYQFCVDDGRDCSPTGPSQRILDWMDTKVGDIWLDLFTFFDASTALPPIYAASLGSGSIAAAQSLAKISFYQVQSDSENNTAFEELSRLSRAGMTILASGSQLAALGYWNLGSGSTAAPSNRLCRNVIIESPNAVSIRLLPYWLCLGLGIFVVILSYAHVLGARKLKSWQKYADPWTLYTAGQLHRQVAEPHDGQYEKGRALQKWPPLKSVQGGLEVVEMHKSKFFVPSEFSFARCSVVPIGSYPPLRQPRRVLRDPSNGHRVLAWVHPSLRQFHCLDTRPWIIFVRMGQQARRLAR